MLSAIYEADFQGFSYGFRPGRSAYHALYALHTALTTWKVLWVLDADIRSFFNSVDHETERLSECLYVKQSDDLFSQ